MCYDALESYAQELDAVVSAIRSSGVSAESGQPKQSVPPASGQADIKSLTTRFLRLCKDSDTDAGQVLEALCASFPGSEFPDGVQEARANIKLYQFDKALICIQNWWNACEWNGDINDGKNG